MANDPKKCKNIFFEDDGYCTRCGEYHFAIASGEVHFHETPKPETYNGHIPTEINEKEWDILIRKI